MSALPQALAHIRNATAALLGAHDPTGELLLAGMKGLDLQDLLGDVEPDYLENDLTVGESLAEAERLLEREIDTVPLAAWATLHELRSQIG